jgi:hypothetical protein
MTNAQHTPGPWHDVQDEELRAAAARNLGPMPYRIVSRDGIHIAIVGGEHQPQFDGEAVEEIAADARLIATAPELLDALKELLECQKFGINALAKQIQRKGNAREKARAVIAKAEGGAP